MKKEKNMVLKKGINLGGFLSQCVHTEEHYDSFIVKEDIERIKSFGFDHVRLPIDSEVIEYSNGNVIEEGYERIDEIINWTRDCGLDIILDLHKVEGYDFNDADNDEKNNLFVSERLQERYLNIWNEVSKRFCKYDNVAFELLNEVVEDKNADAWNVLIKKAVSTIRNNTKDSYIIYGGILWNSASTLKLLESPADDKIIFTFHFYEPLLFTHQKAYWVKAMDPSWEISYPGEKEEYIEKSAILGNQGLAVSGSKYSEFGIEFIEDQISEAIKVGKEKNVRLYCGEFGVIDQAPIEDTLKWFDDVFTVFEKYDIGFSIWTYKEKDFGLVDAHYDPIRERLVERINRI